MVCFAVSISCIVKRRLWHKLTVTVVMQDLIDLRYNNWVARREVEGPKKIDQVHADARRDDANRARAAAGGPNMRGNRGGDYRTGGGLDSYGGPPQRCVAIISGMASLSHMVSVLYMALLSHLATLPHIARPHMATSSYMAFLLFTTCANQHSPELQHAHLHTLKSSRLSQQD